MTEADSDESGPATERRPAEIQSPSERPTLEDLPPEEVREEVVRALMSGEATIVSSHQMMASYSGPLPPPDILEGYDRAVPGSAERILARLEGQTTHRQAMEKRGQTIAAALGGGAIIASVICALAGQPLVAASIVVATMIGIGLTGALSIILGRRDG